MNRMYKILFCIIIIFILNIPLHAEKNIDTFLSEENNFFELYYESPNRQDAIETLFNFLDVIN